MDLIWFVPFLAIFAGYLGETMICFDGWKMERGVQQNHRISRDCVSHRGHLLLPVG